MTPCQPGLSSDNQGKNRIASSRNAPERTGHYLTRMLPSPRHIVNQVAENPAANRFLRVIRAGGPIEEARPASGHRPALFRFAALLDIVEGPAAA